MTQLPGGSGWVCFDTTALIHFNAVGGLDMLGSWFPRAFAPEVVIEEEIRGPLASYPKNQAILDAEWLESVKVEEPGDLKDVAAIHGRFGRRAGKDRGEAEVVVLCARHGWTAIIDDTQGQRAAKDYEASCCTILTTVLAAAGVGLIEARAAWQLHADLEKSRGSGRSALKAEKVHRKAFEECIRRFGRIADQRNLRWPEILALKGADGLVIRTRTSH